MPFVPTMRTAGTVIVALALTAAGTAARPAVSHADDFLGFAQQCVRPDHTVRHELFVTSASENGDYTRVTYPLHTGLTPGGQPVYYVITDASDPEVAAVLGVNYAPKLNNARGTAAVMSVTTTGIERQIVFPATVDFSPQRVLVPGPTGFPPAQAAPGAIGQPNYSPLIQLPDGVILNAPQIANNTGQADKILNIDLQQMRVTYHETEGCYDNESVHYASFEASDPGVAAIEDVTYAPNLNAAPQLNSEDDSTSAREQLIAFTNGQTGRFNPQRQGLSSAILDGLDPLNILHEVPEPGPPDYSPLWEPHLATWSQAAVNARQNTRQTDFATVLQLAQQGTVSSLVTGGFIVTCPVVSLDHTS